MMLDIVCISLHHQDLLLFLPDQKLLSILWLLVVEALEVMLEEVEEVEVLEQELAFL